MSTCILLPFAYMLASTVLGYLMGSSGKEDTSGLDLTIQKQNKEIEAYSKKFSLLQSDFDSQKTQLIDLKANAITGGSTQTVEVEKIVEVPVEVEKIVEIEKIVEVENRVEVPVEVIKEVEVIREVPVIKETEIIKEVELIKEVPVEVIKEIEVIKEVPVEVIKEVQVEVIKEIPVEVIKEVEVEVIREVPIEIIKEVEVVKQLDMESLRNFIEQSGMVEVSKSLVNETSNRLESEIVERRIVEETQEAPKPKAKAKKKPKAKKKRAKKAAAPVSSSDDLKIIEGIGPKLEDILRANGINSFADVAETTPAALRIILSEAGPRYARYNPKTWPRQAKLAVKGQWEKLKELQDSLVRGQ